MQQDFQYDVLIIGSGAAGLSLGLQLATTKKVAVISKDELNAGYLAFSTFPGYYFNIFSIGHGKKDKAVALTPHPDNDEGKAVKEALINNYKFKDAFK